MPWGLRRQRQSHRRTNTSGRESVEHWFSSKPVLISIVLAVVTVALGLRVGSPFQSILVGFLEIVLGVAIWAVRSVSYQLDEFQRDVGSHNRLLSHVWEIGDVTVLDCLTDLAGNLSSLREERVLLNLMRSKLQDAAADFREMALRGAVLHSPRVPSKEVLLIFEAYMNALYDGCRYDTVSNLTFWSRDTLHRPQDFLALNVEAARNKNVKIRRVFLVSEQPDHRQLSELRRHLEAAVSLGSLMKVRIYKLSGQGEHYDDYGTFGICSDENRRGVLLKMLYEETQGAATPETWRRLSKIGHVEDSKSKRTLQAIEVVRSPMQVQKYRRRFYRAFRRGTDLEEYLRKFSIAIAADRSFRASPLGRRPR